MHPNYNRNVTKSDSQIFLYKSIILEKIKCNQVVIIVGQTGCGKSTQIPQYLYQSGYSKNGIIACLHPRCVAAITLAKRVSHEMKTDLGDLVGYSVRFYSQYCDYTKILYMTTGYMLRILQEEGAIDQFSVIIIDEAHEKSVQYDIMMGQMKLFMKRNKYIKLVIMSATLNVGEIEKYYPGSATVRIKEFEDQVEVIYRPPKNKKYIFAIKSIAEEIIGSSERGHILVFLPSEEKVKKCKFILKNLKNSVVLSFYSAMDYDDKMMVFKEFGYKRKVILATNIAETSLTISGVNFVIDSGYVKRARYDHENRVEKWITEPISIAEANQRKGRTGRTGYGKCYRLYEDLQETRTNNIINQSKEVKKTTSQLSSKTSRPDFPIPEIKNINLGGIILLLKSMNIEDINKFPFIVKPDPKSVSASIDHLKELSLLNPDDMINNLGKQVAELPLDPQMGKVAVISSQLSVRQEVFIIIAMSSVINIFKNPTGKEAQICHEKFISKHGDLFSFLNVFNLATENGFTKEWCKENFINYSCLKYARLVQEQLHKLLPIYNKRNAELSRSMDNQIKKAFLSGFFQNIVIIENESYKTISDKAVVLYEGSCLKDCKDVVMGTTVLQSANSKVVVLRNCITLNKTMLNAFVPKTYKVKTIIWKEIMKKITKEPNEIDSLTV